MIDRTLIIYNLETNLDSHVLASAHDWIEEFSLNYSQVFVYTTHKGRLDLPKNVTVIETGGGTIQKRLLAVGKLLSSLNRILRNRSKTDVFHHMSSYTLLFLGLPIKLIKVPQIIWYSHSVADFSLRIGARFAGQIVSATSQTVPKLSGTVVHPIGHGISLPRLGEIPKNSHRHQGIISVGRVVNIKKIEDAITAISNLPRDLRRDLGNLTLVGPYEERSNYLSFLHQESSKYEVDMELLGPMDYRNIPSLFAKTSIVFTGTPKSADKAALEAAMMGCLVLTTNESVQKLTGMDQVLPDKETATNLRGQLVWMLSLSDVEIGKIRNIVATTSREMNSLENLVLKIVNNFEKLRSF
jgi:glycosyltransferase involved in cell wall biosynthesis